MGHQIFEARNLPVTLTPEEMAEKSKALARAQIDIEEQKLKLKDVNADFKAKIANLTSDIGVLSRAVSNGYEYRDVECEWHFNWKDGTKKLIRTDTEEKVREDKITTEDRQQQLDEAAG